MMIKILLTLLLTSIGVPAKMDGKKHSGKKKMSSVYENEISIMERRCKFLEKERLAKRHEVDAAPDKGTAINKALVEGYARFRVIPKVNDAGYARLIGEHEEYWLVSFYNLMVYNEKYNAYTDLKEYSALVSRNSGEFLCGYLMNVY